MHCSVKTLCNVLPLKSFWLRRVALQPEDISARTLAYVQVQHLDFAEPERSVRAPAQQQQHSSSVSSSSHEISQLPSQWLPLSTRLSEGSIGSACVILQPQQSLSAKINWCSQQSAQKQHRPVILPSTSRSRSLQVQMKGGKSVGQVPAVQSVLLCESIDGSALCDCTSWESQGGLTAHGHNVLPSTVGLPPGTVRHLAALFFAGMLHLSISAAHTPRLRDLPNVRPKILPWDGEDEVSFNPKRKSDPGFVVLSCMFLHFLVPPAPHQHPNSSEASMRCFLQGS